MTVVIPKIERQNEIIISLLGRMTFPEEELKKIITSNSKKPDVLLKAYNLCDGNMGLTEIARTVSISQPSITGAINKWEEMGIIVKHITESNLVFPQRLYKLRGV